jgi:ferrous iron transport protein A
VLLEGQNFSDDKLIKQMQKIQSPALVDGTQHSLLLDDAPGGVSHVVSRLITLPHAPEWARWLQEIGFLPGETVKIKRRGMFGGDPLIVSVGQSTFAIRRAEAACVVVEPVNKPL